MKVDPASDWRPSDSDSAEVERRWADYQAGRKKAVPWEEVWSEIEAEISTGKN
ncbi:MAG TPA: addiction module protein [Lacipirellulaceae bacterium]|nr:addiction module protein [Lacipirellulaceae bacterium]